tara:strand:+ start:5275 stop:9510 length:4236 start_codon:yes stop_codon:yes gene_type:complete
MADLAHLKVAVDSRQVRTADKDLRKMAGGAERAERGARGLTGAMGPLKLAMAGLGFGLIAREVIQMADSMTMMEAKVRLVTKSQAELEAVQGRLYDIALDSRTGFEATTELYARMARSADRLGVSQNEVLKVTEAINKATVVSGATATEAQAGIIQLAQGFASGALRGDELRSVLEQMPRVAEMIADGMGITVGQLREFGAQGKLTSKDVFDAILKMSGSVQDEFEQIPLTVGQSLTNLATATTKWVGDINELTGFTSTLAGAIDWLGKNLSLVSVAATTFFTVLAASKGGTYALGFVVGYTKEVIRLEKALGAATTKQALFGVATKSLVAPIRAVNAALLANPFVAVAAAITGLISLVYLYRDEQIALGDETVTMGNVIAGVWSYIKRVVGFVQRAFSEGWGKAIAEVAPALEGLGLFFDAVLGSMLQRAKFVVNGLVGMFVGIGRAAGAALDGGSVKDAFLSGFDEDYLGSLGDAAVGLAVHLNGVGEATKGVTEEAVDLNEAMGEYEATQKASTGSDAAVKKLQNLTNSMAEYIKGLREARGEIGLSELALQRLELTRQRAKIGELVEAGMSPQDAAKMRADLTAAGEALLDAMQFDYVAKVREENAALREQVNLFWEGAEAQARAAAARKASAMELEGDAFTDYVDEQVENDRLQRQLDHLDELKQSFEELRDLSFEIDLEGVFGDWGKALGSTLNVLEDFAERQDTISKAWEAAGDDEGKRAVVREAELRSQMALYSGLTSSAKGFFDEKSAGYAAITAAETAFRAIEFALSVKATAQKVAEGAAKMFATLGPLGFAAVAAMVGVMAGLGFMGGGSSNYTPAYNKGTGTVLGDPEQASESLSRALDLLNQTADATMRHSSSMALSLRKIEGNISGLSRLILSTQGLELSASGVSSGGGFFKSLFGSTKEVIGQGLVADAQSLTSVIANGLRAQYFTDIKKKKKFLGVTTGTSFTTQFAAAEGALQDQLGLFFANVVDVVTDAGALLGVPLEDIERRLQGFVVSVGKIDLKDLSGSEVQAALEAALGAEADRIAAAAIPNLQQFQQVGEGLFETLVRVASTFEVFTDAMRYMSNQTDITLESVMAISDLFGDNGELQQALGDYFNTFYDNSAKLAVFTERLDSVFGDLGFAIPQTLEGFRALVDSLDLNSAAGQEAFVRLMQLAPVFSDVLDLQERVADERGELEENLRRAYQRTASDLQSTIDSFAQMGDQLREFRDTLFEGASGFDSYNQSLARLMRVGALAAAGDRDAMGELQGVSQSFLTTARSRAGSLLEYQRALALVAGYVDNAIEAADEQVSEAQMQLDLLTEQVEALITIEEAVESVEQAIDRLAAFVGAPSPSGYFDPSQSDGSAASQPVADELHGLRQDFDNGLHSLARDSSAQLRVLERWDGAGTPETRFSDLDTF